ncbi:hypothetical protein GLS_c16010 [Gluconobacter oxydans DSM 3504]|uniref:Uncharacterized protein n=1 Tax=Gluconobacter oxydans DSM 3504 TaxID=1288313 RepID=A0A067Z6Z5_GLUOY|nr:hypothetical protein GLS_c16010 [Gluconobacter oxydans DSM 3504]
MPRPHRRRRRLCLQGSRPPEHDRHALCPVLISPPLPSSVEASPVRHPPSRSPGTIFPSP